MMKTDYKNIYRQTRQMLLHPEISWPQTLREHLSCKTIFYRYFLPLNLFISVCVFLIGLPSYTVVQAAGLSMIGLLSSFFGTWFAYLIIREYLCGRLNYPDHQVVQLTVYSSAVFILFHHIGTTLGQVFIGQLFTLLSFIFIRTLYSGLNALPKLTRGQKNNILIIASLSIVCIPIILSQLLMIIFRISAINV